MAETPAPLNRTSSRGRLFRIKSLDSILRDAEDKEHQLRRALGPLQITLLGIGAIIGAGVFATIGTAAAGDASRPGAGPALVLSFVITAVVCSFTALCYAELASMVPISGSAYTYAYATLGEIVAWIIGWDLIIEYAVGNIAVAISWANYFKTLVRGFGIIIPDWLSMDYRTAARITDASGFSTVYRDAPHLLGVPIVFNLPAVLIVAAITIVLVWGIRESARFNAGMVVIKLIVLAFFVAVGCFWVKPENWRPFAPGGFMGISAGAAIVFFAYIGFDAVSTVAEETRDPQRSLPIGIIASLAVCTVVYVVVAAVFTGLISYPDLTATLQTQQAEPLTLALEHVSPKLGFAVGIVAFGSVIAHTAVLLVFQLGQPRIFFSMARDGLLPPAFYKVHPRFRTPHVSTILTGLFVGGFAAVASLDEMVDLTNIGTLFAFILVCAGTIVLRRKDPDRHRPFRVPGGIVLPVLGIVSCLYLIYFLPPTSWLRFAAWLNFGFVVYVGYGAVHSRLTGVHASANRAEHDAHTAQTGGVLAVVGVGLLFFMRGMDLAVAAFAAHADLTGFAGARAALGDVARLSPAWLDPSWFLLVPLALDVGLLAPIVIIRARRARASGAGGAIAEAANRGLVLAGATGVFGIVYLALVIAGR
jgi:basic amino acid/polyamine antiporter, APA family